MRIVFLLNILFVSAFQAVMGEVEGDWEYLVSRNEITITKYIGNNAEIVIPNSINGLPVRTIQSTSPPTSGFKGLNNQVASVVISEGITSIGFYAFAACTNITSITIPNTVKNIGTSAFTTCYNLRTIDIPNSVTSIGYNAFFACLNLAEIIIPNGVTRIEHHTFTSCHKITKIIIPNSVTSIGTEAFGGCLALTEITIPNSVSNIDPGAFNYCESLTGVYFVGDTPSIEANIFSRSFPTIYYFAGTTGWGATFGGLTTVQLTTPTVQSLVFNVNGNAQLSWSAMQGSVYEIQSTDSLDNPFVTRSIQTASNTVETWNEPNSSIPSKRFYRVNMRLP
jgi:hypothetical protein